MTTVLYLRISDEDNNLPFRESESISGQRMILTDFILHHPDLADSTRIEIVDDGYSGTNFDRPGIQSLLSMVKAGTVQCILVKDFSRLGRNYLEVGNYLEQIFPFLGVRFLSVNDQFDSAKNFGAAGSIEVAFKNIICEAYSRDLSVKIKSIRRSKAEQGQFVTAFAPYGLIKSPENKNQLIPDAESAAIVCRIYHLFLDGNSMAKIARILNQEEIPSPLMLRKLRGHPPSSALCNEKSHWSTSTVSQILSDQRYVGDSVYGKVAPKTIGSKKSCAVPRQDWIIRPNAHTGILDRTLFAQVQSRRKTHQYTRRTVPKPLAGKILCGACHHALKRIDRGNGTVLFRCTTSGNTDQYDCCPDSLPESLLEKAILSYLQALSLLTDLPTPSKQKAASPSPLRSERKGITEAIRQKQASSYLLYEAFRAGKQTESVFAKQMADLEAEIFSLHTRLALLAEEEPPGKEAPSPFASLTKEMADLFVESASLQQNGILTLRLLFGIKGLK